LEARAAAAADDDAEIPRFVADDVAEESPATTGTCFGVRAVSVV
jgi:hypothetical protein